MIEACIQCLCREFLVADLNLSLKQGQIVYLDAAKAKASMDLKRAWRVNAVAIKYVERVRERREAPVLTHPLQTPLPPRSMVAAPAEPSEGADILLVDPGEIASRVVSELARSPINERVSIEVGRQLQALEERLVERVVAKVVQALQEHALRDRQAALQISTPRRSPAVPDDSIPVYVPSKIEGSIQANLDLEAAPADEGGVSDAAAALRAVRGKKRGTTT